MTVKPGGGGARTRCMGRFCPNELSGWDRNICPWRNAVRQMETTSWKDGLSFKVYGDRDRDRDRGQVGMETSVWYSNGLNFSVSNNMPAQNEFLGTKHNSHLRSWILQSQSQFSLHPYYAIELILFWSPMISMCANSVRYQTTWPHRPFPILAVLF